MLLEGRIAEGDRVRVEVRDGRVDFDVIRRSEEAPTGSEPSEEAQAAATS